MTFEWYQTEISKACQQKFAQRAGVMYLEEARDRARMLRELGYTQKQAEQRIVRPMEHAYLFHQRPAYLDRIPEVIAEVYRR